MYSLLAIGSALDDPEEFVASRACLAINNLANACEEYADEPTNLLSAYMPVLLQKIYTLANRQNTEDFNLRSDAYSCTNAMIKNSAEDMKQVVLYVSSYSC